MAGYVIFTPEKANALRKAMEQAKKNRQDTFEFEGHEYLVSYAKHLLEFLDAKFRT